MVEKDTREEKILKSPQLYRPARAFFCCREPSSKDTNNLTTCLCIARTARKGFSCHSLYQALKKPNHGMARLRKKAIGSTYFTSICLFVVTFFTSAFFGSVSVSTPSWYFASICS